jgi:hypothetical protein
MSFEDYLLPDENIQFQSSVLVEYGKKPYQVIITDKRLILYNKKGLIFRKEDIASWDLKNIKSIRYKESSIIGLFKKGIIEIHANTKINLMGKQKEIKTLYQQILGYINK